MPLASVTLPKVRPGPALCSLPALREWELEAVDHKTHESVLWYCSQAFAYRSTSVPTWQKLNYVLHRLWSIGAPGVACLKLVLTHAILSMWALRLCIPKNCNTSLKASGSASDGGSFGPHRWHAVG